MSELFAEHIPMPGCPQMIVTRAFLYNFLCDCGWDPTAQGIGSLEWTVMHHAPVADLLTDLWQPWAESTLATLKSVA